MDEGRLVTMAEYRRMHFEPDAEFVDGRIEERPAAEMDHSLLQTQLLVMLSKPEHKAYVQCLPSLDVLVREQCLRVPDVCLLRADAPREQVVVTPPLLCIEVLSPEDTVMGIFRKMDDYLAMGVREVWLVDSVRRVVSVRTCDEMREYRAGMLRLPEVPVTVSIAELFAELDERG